MPSTRSVHNLKHTTIYDHLLGNKTYLYPTADQIPNQTMSDIENSPTTFDEILRDDQEAVTVDTNQQKPPTKSLSGNQYSLQTTTQTSQQLMENTHKPSTIQCRKDITETVLTFSGKKNEDAGKWLDHICKVIEQEELTSTEQRDVAAGRLTDDALLWYRINRFRMPNMESFIKQFLHTYNSIQTKVPTANTMAKDVHYTYTLTEETMMEKESEEMYDNTSKSIIEEDHHSESRHLPISPRKVLQSARNEKVKLFPNFSGSENSLNWLKNLQQMGKSLKLNEQQIFELAIIKLNGPAQEWFYHQDDEIDNWSSFKQAFLYAFPPPIQPTNIDYLAQLLARKQGETEPVGKFVQDINRLCLKLDTKISEQDKLQYLRKGLRPQLQHYALSITSLQDFLTIMQRHEQIEKEKISNQQSVSFRSLPRSSQRQQDLFNNRMSKHHDHQQNQSSPRYESVDRYRDQNSYYKTTTQHYDNTNKICYQCNKPGHLQWDCPDGNSTQQHQEQHFQQRSH